MTGLRSLYCRRCDLLDGDAYGRTCIQCRWIDTDWADARRAEIIGNLASAEPKTVGGQVIRAYAQLAQTPEQARLYGRRSSDIMGTRP